MRLKQYILNDEISRVKTAMIRHNIRQSEISKNPPTDKTHVFIGATKDKGWKKSTAPMNNITKYENAVIVQRKGFIGWWIAVPKPQYKEIYHGDIENQVQRAIDRHNEIKKMK